MSKILLSIYRLPFLPHPHLVVNLEVHRAENRWPLNIKISTRCVRVDRDPVLDPWPSVRQTETITAGYLFKRRSGNGRIDRPKSIPRPPFALLNPCFPLDLVKVDPRRVDNRLRTHKSRLWDVWKVRRGRISSYLIFGKIFFLYLLN